MKKIVLIVLAMNLFAGLSAQTATAVKIKTLVSKMTLDEKVNLVVGMGMNFPGMNLDSTIEEKVPGAAGNTFAIPRLQIPRIVLSDGPAGVRIDSIRNGKPGKTFYATAWPVATLIASTWDTKAALEMGKAFGTEVHEYGIDVLLAPALNIHRNPLGGRNFEYFSEDPLIAGNMTAALVNGIQSNGVGTSIKHFVANNEETDRNTMNVVASQRALREIYLKGFEIAVKKSQPWTVMSSYNLVNGTYTSQNYDLLTTILRKEWGFKGLVMTDWYSGDNPVAQMKAGNDLLMAGRITERKAIKDAVQSGALDMKVLDLNVSRILNIILKSPAFNNYAYSEKPDLKKDAQISKSVAEGGMVLLKNADHTLPFTPKDKKIALFGIHAYELIAGGTGSGDVNKAYAVALSQGIADAGLSVDSKIKDIYTQYVASERAKRPKKSFMEEFTNPTLPIGEYAANQAVIDESANVDDAAIILIGKNAGEGRDRMVTNDFILSEEERSLISNVSASYHAKNKKVIVVLNIGGVIEVASWRDQTDAILLAWQPGLEGGHAITDLLVGKVNPSGKLATTFPLQYNDVPSAKNFPGKELTDKPAFVNFGIKMIPAEVKYEEGIYVGYRYYETYHVQPAYEFGYGLSYTSFSYSDLTLSSSVFNDRIGVSFKVKNTGKTAGREVVQLYLTAPADQLDKPAEELKGFAKTGLLAPGQTETVQLYLKASDLASFNPSALAWIADAGKYTVKIGASSRDIRLNAQFTVKQAIQVEKVHDVLNASAALNENKGQ